MSVPAQNVIALAIKSFPQNILIKDQKVNLNLDAIHYLNSSESFKFVFEGENLNIDVPEEFRKETIQFEPGETKNFNITISPTVDGVGKVIITIYSRTILAEIICLLIMMLENINSN